MACEIRLELACINGFVAFKIQGSTFTFVKKLNPRLNGDRLHLRHRLVISTLMASNMVVLTSQTALFTSRKKTQSELVITVVLNI